MNTNPYQSTDNLFLAYNAKPVFNRLDVGIPQFDKTLPRSISQRENISCIDIDKAVDTKTKQFRYGTNSTTINFKL